MHLGSPVLNGSSVTISSEEYSTNFLLTDMSFAKKVTGFIGSSNQCETDKVKSRPSGRPIC